MRLAGAGQGCLGWYQFVFRAAWLVCLFALKLMWWVCVCVCVYKYIFKTYTPKYVWEDVAQTHPPLRLIESFRGEKTGSLRESTRLSCPATINLSVAEKTTHIYSTHTQLSNMRVIALRVCVCARTSVLWHVEIPKALAKSFSVPDPSL